MHILAKVIGEYWAKQDGLNLVVVPHDLPDSFIGKLCVNACKKRSPEGETVYDYCVVITNTELNLDANILQCDEGEAGQSRIRNRLFVARPAQSSQKATYISSVKPVMHHGYPSDANPLLFSLHDLSGNTVELLFNSFKTKFDALADKKIHHEALDWLLNFLRDSYQNIGNSGKNWTDAWWVHVDIFLDTWWKRLEAEEQLSGAKISTIMFSAAGLPTPDSLATRNLHYSKRNDHKRYCSILGSNWNDRLEILDTIEKIELTRKSDERPIRLKKLDWINQYRATSIQMEHIILRTCCHTIDDEHIERARAWEDISESDFFGSAKIPESGVISFSIEDKRLPGNEIANPSLGAGIALLPPSCSRYEIAGGIGKHVVEGLEIILPLNPDLPLPSEDDVKNSSIGVVCARASMSIEVYERNLVNDEIILKTKSSLTLQKEGDWNEKAIDIQIKGLNPTDSLFGKVDQHLKGKLVVPSPFAPTLILKEKSKLNISAHSSLSIVDDKLVNLTDREVTTIVLSKGEDIIIFSCDGRIDEETLSPTCLNKPAKYRGSACGKISEWKECSVQSGLNLDSGDEIEIDGFIFRVEIPNKKKRPILPLLATARGVLPSDEELDIHVKSSLQGTLESMLMREFLAGKIDAKIKKMLPVYVLSEDYDCPVDKFVDEHGLFWSFGVPKNRRKLKSIVNYPDRAFLDSDQLRIFWEAFEGLGLDKCSKRTDGKGQQFNNWLSRSSLMGIQQDKLEEYLDAYIKLVEHAKEQGPDVRFWATYPFSFMVTKHLDNKLNCILLSPYHPVRLAWLWSAEQSVLPSGKEPKDERLLQLIEGWNFPYYGPGASISGGAIFMALPIESGFDQVFIGWSSLVIFDASHGEIPTLPEKAAGKLLPGSSGTGLNAGGIGACVRDYLKIFPHVSTLSIELYADDSARSPRSLEMDRSVISEIAATVSKDSSTRESLPGGVRVYDSVNRIGLAPGRDEILNQAFTTEDTFPIQWSRYKSDSIPKTDIRLIQGTSAGITAERGRESNGIIPVLPIKRFVLKKSSGDGSVVFSPSVSNLSPSLLGGFVEALAVIESYGKGEREAEFIAQLDGSFGNNEKSKWTVLGDMFLEPDSASHVLQPDGESINLLWEWRPAFLSHKSTSTYFDRRPYVTIANIPDSFKASLARKVSKVIDVERDQSICAEEVLRQLGTRGIGLSSLLAMGHHHSTGALGFKFAYSLFDSWLKHSKGSEKSYYILPIDSVDPVFLSIIKEKSGEKEEKTRADLIILELEIGKNPTLKLVPIEVKFYGLQKKSGEEPGPFEPFAGSAVGDALKQLAFTSRRIERACKVQQGLKKQKEDVLINVAFSSILEAAYLVNSMNSETLDHRRKALELLSVGNLNWEARAGLLLWFKQDGSKDGGPKARAQKNCERPKSKMGLHAELQIDPPACQDSLWDKDENAPASILFKETLLWCLDNKATCIELAGADDKGADDNGGDDKGADDKGADDKGADDKGADDNGGDDSPRNGIKIWIGNPKDGIGEEKIYFQPGNTDCTSLNLGIVGDQGTGKTQATKSIIYQLLESKDNLYGVKPKFLILDYKHDYSGEFAESIGAKVVKPVNIPINFFNTGDKAGQHSVRADSAYAFYDILEKVYSNVGPVQKNKFMHSVLNSYAELEHEKRDPTIWDVAASYKSDLRSADAVSSVLDDLTIFGHVFEKDHKKALGFDEFFDRTTIVSLGDLGEKDEMKDTLVVVFLNMFYKHMLGSKKHGFQGNARCVNSYLLVDEAMRIMKKDFAVLKSLLSEGREFGSGVLLASQHLSHFKATGFDYKEPLLTWLIHSVPNITSRELEQIGLIEVPGEMPNKVRSLKKFNCLFKSFNCREGRYIKTRPYFEIVNDTIKIL